VTAAPPFKRIALIGLGLIGSSLARGIQQLGLAGELVATDHSPEVRARAV
jgi:cyclohexadieny/prephenate dehydrogenase